MRVAAAAVVAFALAGCAVAPQAPAGRAGPAMSTSPPPAAVAPVPALTLRNASFESDMPADRTCPVGWYCTMHGNPKAFRYFLRDGAAGGRSVCIERVVDEPWALLTQGFESPVLRGGPRLRLSMAVLLEGVSGAGAGPWALVEGNPPANPQKLVRGTAGWQRVAIDIAVPANGRGIEVGATLEGPGKACFDDVRLEVLTPG